MSKKPNTAAALAGILNAKRGEESASPPPPAAELPIARETLAPPSPAPPENSTPPAAEVPAPASKARVGKSKDKATYSQFSVYLRKDTRKRAGRLLEDTNPGQDFSELVQELLEQWITSHA